MVFCDFGKNLLVESIIEGLHMHRSLDQIISIQEYGMEIASRMNSRLGLPAVAIDTILNTRDKNRMRRKLDESSITNVPYRSSADAKELVEFAQSVGFPVIVKPLSQCGSLFVSKAENERQLRDAIQTLKDNGEEEALVERYINGEHYGILTYTQDGVHHALSIVRIFHDPVVGQGTFASIGQFVGPSNEAPLLARYCQRIDEFLAAMDIESGPCWTEFRLSNGEIFFIETQCRYPAGYIMDMIYHSRNIDVHELLLADITGTLTTVEDFIASRERPRQGAAVRFYTPKPGLVTDIRLPAELRDPNVLRHDLKIKPGSVMQKMTSEADRQGFALVLGATSEEAYDLASKIVDKTQFVYSE